jgi:hypothetical protein
MLKKSLVAVTATAALLSATNAFAWKQTVHKEIVIDAVHYMQAHPDTTQFNRLKAAANAAGYTIDQFADALGQGAYDVDDFQDTYICGAITGDCQYAPVWSLASPIVKYTSYWHFENHTRGRDVHGNPYGGYDYSKLTVWGAVDDLAASWLWGDYLDDGKGGMHGWWWADNSKYDSYGKTEAHYRQGTYSTKDMYKDFQNMPFQPISNLAEYWYTQFVAHPNVQLLGFVLHSTDLGVAQHVWVTSALNHSGYESWVQDYYYKANLNDFNRVTQAFKDLTPIPAGATDIRPLLHQLGQHSYENGGIVLSSTDYNDRLQVASDAIAHSIATVVLILNHAASQF